MIDIMHINRKALRTDSLDMVYLKVVEKDLYLLDWQGAVYRIPLS